MLQLQTGNCKLGTVNRLCSITSLLSIIILLTALNLKAQNPFIQHYTTSDGLPSNVVWKIFQDSENSCGLLQMMALCGMTAQISPGIRKKMG